MSNITRINEFQAKEGQEDKLYDFLQSIISLIEQAAGCQSCQLLRGHEDATRLAIIEVWSSVEAHQASVKLIPPGYIEQAMTMFAVPPRGIYYQ